MVKVPSPRAESTDLIRGSLARYQTKRLAEEKLKTFQQLGYPIVPFFVTIDNQDSTRLRVKGFASFSDAKPFKQAVFK